MGERGFDESLDPEEAGEDAAGPSGEEVIDVSNITAFLLIHPSARFSRRTRNQPGFSARIAKLLFI